MNVRWITHYNSDQKILLVGEGDLSFSVCLARAFGSGLNMVSTSFDSKELLKEKYWRSEANVEELERLGCLVLHEVDVKEMSNHPILKQMKFDDVVYNFPHAGHFYGYSETDAGLIQMHKELLRDFFLSARGMLNQGGEVHVSHREDYPYSTWGLENLAAKSGFNLKEKVLFQKWDYPGYRNVRGGDINCNNPFPLNSHCFTYKFCLEENYNDQPQWNDQDGADLMAFRYSVMRKFANKKKGTNKKRRAVKLPSHIRTSDVFFEKHLISPGRNFWVQGGYRTRGTLPRVPSRPISARTAEIETSRRERVEKAGERVFRSQPSVPRSDSSARVGGYHVVLSLHPKISPYRGNRWCDDADLVGSRYMDCFEHQVAKYKQRRDRHCWMD